MILGIEGGIGAGKTHTALEEVFAMMNENRKALVTNIDIDTAVAWRWCLDRGLYTTAATIRNGRIFYTRDIVSMLRYRDAVVLVDEAGVNLASKMFMGREYKVIQPFIADLLQSRKGGTDLVYIAQDAEDVATELRTVTNQIIHVIGVTSSYKFITWFPRLAWKRWKEAGTFKLFMKGQMKMKLRRIDTDLFRVYNTLERLDGKPALDLAEIERTDYNGLIPPQAIIKTP